MSSEPCSELDPFEERWMIRQRAARTRRAWIAGLALTLGPLFVIYYWFAQVVSPAVDVDLWLSVSSDGAPGQTVLVDSSARDPRTGEILEAAAYSLRVRERGVSVAEFALVGGARTLVELPAAASLSIEVAVSDRRIGEVVAHHAVQAASVIEEGARGRGGLVGSAGLVGLGLVRQEGVCDYRVRALAAGGAAVVGVRNEIFFEVRDASGAAVVGASLRAGASSMAVELVDTRTSELGMARATAVPVGREYVELIVRCAGGEQLVGFELEPIFDGVVIASLRAEPDGGLSASVETNRMGGSMWWSLVCAGDVRDWGRLEGSSVVKVSAERLRSVAGDARCRLEVVRDPFVAERGWFAREFLRADVGVAAQWALAERGILAPSTVRAQAFAQSRAALDAWSDTQRARIRWSLWGLALIYGVAWAIVWRLTMIRTVLTTGAQGRMLGEEEGDDASVAGVLDESRVDLVSSVSALLAGWLAVAMLVGGFGFVLSLMGL